MKLTPKQKKFCQYYASCGNATKSATKAGYSEKTAYSQGQRLLKSVEIQKYLKSLTKKDEETRIITAQEMQEMYSKILRGEIKFKDYCFVDGDKVETEVPTKLSDWNKTSELLMKLQGAYTQKMEIQNQSRVYIVNDLEQNDELDNT